MDETACFNEAGASCGDHHWNPSCHGKGYLACGYHGCVGDNEVAQVCLFRD
jgi:hypothetical protein